ncbi:hypothetical protein [Pseudactinotalea suaedae]|uniref:hypothetical protein n=1 Tax=Pseudactinotalea suaedae TaxID=1524924 RepID=UPI0012E11D38|nr:hypothetical protein [Pseudactinotalea suaedae]
MDTVLFGAYAVAYLVLLVWVLTLASRSGWPRSANLPLLVVAGLVYDNAVIAGGRLLGEGPLLEALSVGRFWIHAFVTPLLVLWAWDSLRRAGVAWARTRVAATVAALVVVGLVVVEIVTVLMDLQLGSGEVHGVLSYSSAGSSGPPVMPLVVAAGLVVAGVGLWRRQRWPWLLLGALAMSVGSAVEIPVPSAAVTNAFELILLTAIVATIARQDRDGHREHGATVATDPSRR